MEITAKLSSTKPVTGFRPSILLKNKGSRTITGFWQRVIRNIIWTNIFLIALRKFRNPVTAIKKVYALRHLRDQYRTHRSLNKYIFHNGRYYINYNTPGWPSRTFSRYIKHLLNRFSNNASFSLHTLVFAITKKCGFKCEHCCEWLNLNQPETLSREEVLLILHKFYDLGIAQVQLSGGEPLNRLKDIHFLLLNRPPDLDIWLYTTGHSLTSEKAVCLKSYGLRGITISLDHPIPEKHNKFRGISDAWEKAIEAVGIAKEAGLMVCLSLCATREFTNDENLEHYGRLAHRLGVDFIQILEPKPVGHYAGKDVLLGMEEQKTLEYFFKRMNYDSDYSDFPIVTYHGYNNRVANCSGAAKDYVYVDTDGDIHNCPFCQYKICSAFDDALPELLEQMRTSGCGSLNSCFLKK